MTFKEVTTAIHRRDRKERTMEKPPSGNNRRLYIDHEGDLVPLPEEISVKNISLTLPLALTAFAVVIPAIIAWAINYYRVGENAHGLHKLETKYELMQQIQYDDSTNIRLAEQQIDSIEDSVSEIKAQQNKMDTKLDRLLVRDP